MFSLEQYLDALASAEPTPGGGSAAASVGAIGAALVAMTARVALRSKRLSAVHDEAARIAVSADALRAEFLAAGAADERAYREVVAAYGMPKDDDASKAARIAALEAALGDAAEAPLDIARIGHDVAVLARHTLTLGNTALFSDVLCGAEFAVAAISAAAANVRINHRSMRDEIRIADQAQRLAQFVREADAALVRIRSVEETG